MKRLMIIVATTSLPAVDRPNADRWNDARSCQNQNLDQQIKSYLYKTAFQRYINRPKVDQQLIRLIINQQIKSEINGSKLDQLFKTYMNISKVRLTDDNLNNISENL